MARPSSVLTADPPSSGGRRRRGSAVDHSMRRSPKDGTGPCSPRSAGALLVAAVGRALPGHRCPRRHCVLAATGASAAWAARSRLPVVHTVVEILVTTFLGVGGIIGGGTALFVRRLHRANRLVATHASAAPTRWLWSWRRTAVLHRRLRRACQVARQSAGSPSPAGGRARRRGRPPTSPLARVGQELVDAAVALDSRLVGADRLRGTAPGRPDRPRSRGAPPRAVRAAPPGALCGVAGPPVVAHVTGGGALFGSGRPTRRGGGSHGRAGRRPLIRSVATSWPPRSRDWSQPRGRSRRRSW